MNVYIKTLFFAIPIFIVLIIIEMIASRIKGVVVNRSSDTISSLSSGMSNIINDALKFGVVIISYSWLVDKMTIYKLEPVWAAVLFAFIIQDFSGYWIHRLNHRVNIFWNRHVIHHSSEEFNLSCALRQSISTTFKFSAILMIPAALMGIPASIFAILGPIHLFMQFWYHTRLINKMGILEYILVTPSHHRVHHAINSEYLDKNYSQIFIIWDKLFNTFQPELPEVKPVYGTLRPASTWNPIIINFKHVWQLIKDAWHSEKIIDKLRIWFMPTGWRPEDIKEKFPLDYIENPYNQVKYSTKVSKKLTIWAWTQFAVTDLMVLHLLMIVDNQSLLLNYWYAIFIMINIFSFTSMLDYRKYIMTAESIRMIVGVGLIFYQDYSWFSLNLGVTMIIIVYFIGSFLLTYRFSRSF